MVRLRTRPVLVLDEPEIYLHPEKQNNLIRLLREHHRGAVITATHSVEMMNNVSVSHIVHVQKIQPRPQIKTTDDRNQLNVIRSQIGSNFNLVASQFEDVDIVVLAEDHTDLSTISDLAVGLKVAKRMYAIPLHGFSEYRKAGVYRDAYQLLIGNGTTDFVCVLDRDYYPSSYLTKVYELLADMGVRVHFTPGKEIENLYLHPDILRSLVPQEDLVAWETFWDGLFQTLYDDALGTAVKLYGDFTSPRPDAKTVLGQAKQSLDAQWNDRSSRYLALPGKDGLRQVRSFHQSRYGRTLTQKQLTAAILDARPCPWVDWVAAVFAT